MGFEIRTTEPQPKITGSYLKKSVFIYTPFFHQNNIYGTAKLKLQERTFIPLIPS